MELREMIEAGAQKIGSQNRLAIEIGETAQTLTGAKAGRRGIPDKACARLAQILEMDFGAVIAARNRALAKSDEEKNFWKKVAAIAAVTVLSGTALPPESQAAQGFVNITSESMYIMSTRRRYNQRDKRREKVL